MPSTTYSTDDIVQCVISAQAALRAAEDILASIPKACTPEDVQDYLDSVPMYEAAGLVPDCVQEYIVEESLRNGSVDIDEAIEALDADVLIDRLRSRGDLETTDPDTLQLIAGEIRDLRFSDLEDVIADANEIANKIENLL